MEKEKFTKTIKVVLKMASINFIKAVVETGYMEEFYQTRHFEQLEASIT